MALFLIFGGAIIGFVAGATQYLFLGASFVEGLMTYFSFGFGVPAAVGAAKWTELKLRGRFRNSPILAIASTDG